MWEFLESLENSSFAIWVAESPSVFAYSTVLALHTLGLAFLVGLSTMIALRVLGFAPRLPVAPMEKFFPLIILGFWVNAVSGVVLFMLAARSLVVNPDFYVKLAGILGAVVTLRLLRTVVFRVPTNPATGIMPAKAKILASAMLACWGIAIIAGRLTAYSSTTMRQTAVAVVIVTVVVLLFRYIGARLLGSHRPAQQEPVMTSTNF